MRPDFLTVQQQLVNVIAQHALLKTESCEMYKAAVYTLTHERVDPRMVYSIVELYCDAVESGKPTMRKIAHAANVSMMTVSRTLQGAGIIGRVYAHVPRRGDTKEVTGQLRQLGFRMQDIAHYTGHSTFLSQPWENMLYPLGHTC